MIADPETIIHFDEIIYFKAEGCYTRVFYRNHSILISKVLKKIEIILPKDKFFRIHKSYLVNTKFISSIRSNRLFLRTNIELPVSRRKRNNLLKDLSKCHLIIKGN